MAEIYQNAQFLEGIGLILVVIFAYVFYKVYVVFANGGVMTAKEKTAYKILYCMVIASIVLTRLTVDPLTKKVTYTLGLIPLVWIDAVAVLLFVILLVRICTRALQMIEQKDAESTTESQ